MGLIIHRRSGIKLLKSCQYGVLVFRKTVTSDEEHVFFSRRIGDPINMEQNAGSYRRSFEFPELLDVSNINQEDGKPLDPESPRAHFNRGNALFHSDGSYRPQRASWSMLRSVILPPPGTGGETEFTDTRTAWEELDDDLKKELLQRDLVGVFSLLHNRKLGSPDFFSDLVVETQPMHRHKIVQVHEPSGRTNIYLGYHCHHLETSDGKLLPGDESAELFKKLMDHVKQAKYRLSVDWLNVGDLVAWDNRCVLHRATGGSYQGKYIRDVRRTTLLDDSPTAWGLNQGKKLENYNMEMAARDKVNADVAARTAIKV